MGYIPYPLSDFVDIYIIHTKLHDTTLWIDSVFTQTEANK